MADDTDALLRDLESRASSSSSAARSDDSAGAGDDIEAFLRELDGDSYVAPPEDRSARPVATADAEIEAAVPVAAPDAPMEKAKPKKLTRAEKKALKEEEKAAKKAAKAKSADGVAVVERGESDGLKIAARVAKLVGVAVPLASAWWVLGAYLANWVSAGWLVFLVATMTVLGLPGVLLLASKRGRYLWWSIATSLLLAVGLVAPFPGAAAGAMISYGHWPASAIAEVAGLDNDSFVVSAAASVSGWVGGIIEPQVDDARKPLALGTEVPLSGEAESAEAPAEDVAPAEETAPAEEAAPTEEAPAQEASEQGE